MDEPIQLPIDGVLDLHTFSPREIKDLVPDYLAACRERGIFQVSPTFDTGRVLERVREHRAQIS
jgi:DNA-nicking Smr family endonuclease